MLQLLTLGLVLASAISRDNDHDHRGKRILVSQDHGTDHRDKRILISQEEHDHDHEVKRILIQDNYYSIMSKLDALTKKVDGLTAQNTALVAQNHNLSVEVERLKTNAASPGHGVAFFAKLTKAVTGHNHFLHYDDVTLNVGNAYNSNHGVFVAPLNGTYHFDLYVCSAGGHTVILNLMVNQTLEGSLLCNDQNYNQCRSNAFTVSLKAGDDVYVKMTDNADNIMVNYVAFGLPSFSGFLISAH